MFRRSLFVLLSFFHLAIVLSVLFNLRIRIATLVSSNSSVDPVSGKLKYYKPDICCLQMLFLITIIITESKMTIIWYMYMKLSDTNPDTCNSYYKNDEPMWCHYLSKWYIAWPSTTLESSILTTTWSYTTQKASILTILTSSGITCPRECWKTWVRSRIRKIKILQAWYLLFTDVIPNHNHNHRKQNDQVRVTRSLALCVCFVDRCLSFCPFFTWLLCFPSSSIYGFGLPLWYLQTLLAWCP
jgi:hypothetical protein